MSVLMGYSGGGPSAGGGGGGGGGGPSGDLLYQDAGCGLPSYQDSGSCVGGLSAPFQESPCGLQSHDIQHPSHHLDSNGLGGYGSDLDSLGGESSSSPHLPYSPEPEAPLYSGSLDYGSAGSGNNNNNNISGDGGMVVGGGGMGMMGLAGHGDVISGSGEGFVGGGGGGNVGGGGGRPRRRRRTPPKAKIDINDNSLYSVYCIFKSILSASTASTVAIDNKIEQAMDLVKSHLMFAVREEVEVLKEKISELMERINQLEYENTVLRQYATQEALQQLQQPHHSSNT